MKKHRAFITAYPYHEDASKPGRIMDIARVGEVFVTRLRMKPRVVTGNLYHKKTHVIVFVTEGQVKFTFVQVNTGEKRVVILEPGSPIVHWPAYVACASENVAKRESTVVFFSNQAFRSKDDYKFDVV
jgi:dTDP-4-dehydrorhamnose 3,5-epimerase-like enzyme